MSYCPYPSRCVYDDCRRSGSHFCGRVECVYPQRCIELLNEMIARVEERQLPGWKIRCKGLKEQRAKLQRQMKGSGKVRLKNGG